MLGVGNKPPQTAKKTCYKKEIQIPATGKPPEAIFYRYGTFHRTNVTNEHVCFSMMCGEEWSFFPF